MDKNFGGVIWTNHALQRLKERNIKQGDAWATWRSPEQSRYAKSQNAWVYYKTHGSQRIEVVAAQNDKKEWLILSVWSKEIFPGQTLKTISTNSESIWRKILRLMFGL